MIPPLPSRRWLALIGVAAAPPVVEALVLVLVGFKSAVGLAPQASALSPYGSLHDLRWVLVYHNTWPALAGELVAAVLVRGAVATALTALAWPPGVARPPLWTLARRNTGFAALSLAVLWPWATIAVVASEVSLSWVLFLELVPVLILAPVLQAGGLVPGWWRGLPSVRTIVLSLLNFAVLTVAGAAAWLVPDGWAVPVAGLFGAVNALLWSGALRQALLPSRPVRWRRVPVAPIAVGLVAVAMLGADNLEATISRVVGRPPPPVIALPQVASAHRPVIFLAGYDSAFPGGTNSKNQPVVRFSYRGTDAKGMPRPYTAEDTHQSLVLSAGLLAEQVDKVHRRTGQPIALVGESEGSLILRYYLSHGSHPAVDTAILTSPIVRAGRTYYPPPQARAGWGVGTGWLLRGLLDAIGTTNRVPDSADEPFLRSLMDNAPFFRNEMLCPVPGVRMIAILPTADATAVPPGSLAEIPVVEVTGFHGLLIDRPAVLRTVLAFLIGRSVVPPARWDYSIVHRVAGAWQAPALALRLNPVWHNGPLPDASFDRQACPR
jgi:hypothetical protein